MEDILKTCLHQKHLDLGAKMMPFGGFDGTELHSVQSLPRADAVDQPDPTH